MSQTLYTKPVNGMPPPPPVEQHTIHVKPTGTPSFQFLQKDKYLSEFKTEVDKARVRENLGIPDEYSYNWGHIRGAIENQSDLMAILNTLKKKQSTLETQLTGINSIVNNLVGEDDQSTITTQELYRQFLDLKINVAQNSTDISQLITGGDTTLSTQISTNLANINTLKERVAALEGRPTIDASLTARVTALENKTDNDTIYDDTNVRQLIANLTSQVTLLQQEIGGNVTTGITSSRTSINATPNSSNIPITITATYSKLKDQDVTELCDIQVEDETVATWNNGQIVINSELEETKITHINFTYDGFTVSVQIKVEVQSPVVLQKQYVGFASNASQIFENSQFECDSVAKVWNSTTPVYGTPWYYFFIITTQNVVSISEVGNYDLSEIRDGQLTSQNGTVYTVYKIGPVSSTEGLNINVTIQ